MKTFHLALFTFLVSVQIVFAQIPELVADLNPGVADGFDQSNYRGVYLGDNIIFPANNGSSGLELFILKAGKIVLLKDINPGQNGSSPSGLIGFKGKIYFTAFVATIGVALWVTDGTSEGTQMVVDVSTATINVHPTGLTVSKSGYLYFSVDAKLFRSDGTAAGTKEVSGASNVNLAPNREYTGRVVCPYNNDVAFLTQENRTIKLWKADDKAVLLGEIKSSSSFIDFYGLTQVKAGLAFGAFSDFDETLMGLYVFQAQNDTIVKLPINNKTNIEVGRFMMFNDSLVLGLDLKTGYFSTDGTPEGTQILSTSRPSYLVQAQPIPHIKFGKFLVFRESEGSFSQNFLVTDGTKAGTKTLTSLDVPFISEFIGLGEYIFWTSGTFNGFNPEIWQSKPSTRSSTRLYKYTERSNSAVNSIIPLGIQDNKLYFISRLNTNAGGELHSLKLNVVITSTKAPENKVNYALKSYGNQITIDSPNGTEKVQVNIYDLLGRKIKTIKAETGSTLQVNVPQNIYLVEAIGKYGQFCQKVWLGQ